MSRRAAFIRFPLYVLLFVFATIAFTLSACNLPATVQHVTTVVGKGSDAASLTLSQTDVAFNSGPDVAQSVALYMGGHSLKVMDPRCKVVNNGFGCDLGDILGVTNIAFTGSDVSVNVSYFRADLKTPLFFYVRQPPP
jgi:hypothetical protein